MPNVINCSAVTDCSNTSWDLMFCICNGGGCTPASSNYTNEDTVTGLVGVYSTTCQSASNSPSTGGGSAAWANPGNAKSDDGTFSDITGDVPIGPKFCSLGSQYLTLTNYGFNIPTGSAVAGIAIGVKAKPDSGNTGSVMVYNVALTLGGTFYYLLDPRGDFCQSGYSALAPYPVGFTYMQDAGATINSDWVGALNNVVFIQPLAYSLTWPSPGPGGAGAFMGSVPGCTPASTTFGPIEKSFTNTTLKQTWSVADVNDPTFGAALSIASSDHTQILHVDCMGIAIYYTPGAGGVIQPNVWINS